MAATLTPSNELTFISFPIDKFEKTVDGDLIVYGKATDGSVDSDEQIVDTDFSQKAIQEWLATGANVRVQHNAQRDPAGVGIEANTDADGTTWVKSLVCEPVAKTLVEKKALRAYSVGIARPKIVRDNVARGGRIVDGQIVEISLVDRPANKNCGIQLVKADKDGGAEWVGKMFGDNDMLLKNDSVTVDLPRDVSVSFSPADLAKLLRHREIAEKRQMDPSVGGGVDRDKIPAADFAGRDRSFPIVTPGDVQDAASSIGRAGSSNYSSDKLKANIIRIARRKGDAFVAQLPESWKKELGISARKGDDVTDVEKGDAAFPGAHEPFSSEHQAVDGHTGHKAAETDDDDGEDHVAEPDETKGAKGAKTCPGCGKGFDADSKLRSCPSCGKKLPKSGGKPKDEAMKSMSCCGGCSCDGACTGCGNCSCECGKCMGMGKTDKGAGTCPQCGHSGSGKFCSECGAKMGAMKTDKPTPGDDVVGEHVTAVPEHREPDGPAIEALEHDMHVPTVPDASVKAAERVKSVGASFDLGALHDLTCPAFDRAEVGKAYPSHDLHTVDVSAWQQKALDAAANASLDEAQKMTQLWQHVVTIKGADHDMLDEIRDEAHKSFQDANPGPGSFPTPGELSPVRFNRPFITEGHATPSTDHDAPNSAHVPTSTITAEQFTRGYVSDGHAAQSPSNKGRSFYRNIQRDAARAALSAMHDHIAQTFPDLCSMHADRHPGTAPNANPAATHVGKSVEEPMASTAAPEVKKSKKDKGKVITKAVSVDADLIKSTVTDALTPLIAQVKMLTKALDEERVKNARLAETVEELSNLPDPTVTAFKGVAAQNALKSSAPVVSTVASAAERTQAALMAALTEQARHSPDPSQREAAWAKLYQMNGIQ